MSGGNKDAPPPYPGGPDLNVPPQYPPTSQPFGPPTSQGYNPSTSQGYSYPSQTQGGGVTVVQGQPVATQPVIVRAGNCPNCGAGILVDKFTCCGIVWAIICFPIGLICLMMSRRNVCTNCGFSF